MALALGGDQFGSRYGKCLLEKEHFLAQVVALPAYLLVLALPQRDVRPVRRLLLIDLHLQTTASAHGLLERALTVHDGFFQRPLTCLDAPGLLVRDGQLVLQRLHLAAAAVRLECRPVSLVQGGLGRWRQRRRHLAHIADQTGDEFPGRDPFPAEVARYRARVEMPTHGVPPHADVQSTEQRSEILGQRPLLRGQPLLEGGQRQGPARAGGFGRGDLDGTVRHAPSIRRRPTIRRPRGVATSIGNSATVATFNRQRNKAIWAPLRSDDGRGQAEDRAAARCGPGGTQEDHPR
ncbi:hypothetical protein E5Z02_01075 [Streptomyces rhizosphaericola]|uniref:Uncharacterized protein n=1 Tax=Streptomyces rhizosphaericola TaxID=2564098 RepID=A0ABY2PLY5_9ACTN|nr:hypothetical protein E5Z02_01075 [Streptomyces rhizosphaericola]